MEVSRPPLCNAAALSLVDHLWTRTGRMSLPACPQRAELFEFAVGNLPRPAFARIAALADGCAGCVSALEALAGPADPLLVRLRQPAHGEGLRTDELPPGLLDAARAARTRRPPAPGPRHLGRFELLQELGLGSF